MDKLYWLDLVNSLFFVIPAIAMWLNVYKLVKDKEIKGVKLIPAYCFSASTLWGMYYYYQIGQIGSFLTITFMAMGNTTWTSLAVYYTYRKK